MIAQKITRGLNGRLIEHEKTMFVGFQKNGKFFPNKMKE